MVHVAKKMTPERRQSTRRARRWPRLLVRALLAVLGLLLVAAAGGYLYLYRSLPQRSGEVKVAGLSSSVDIVRDADGVPHIYADSSPDAYFGLGYVHAQDRLWQMEYQRRVVQGRLAEIFGPDAIQRDRMLRTVGIYRAAVKAWETFPADSKLAVSAYVAGINAFINSHTGGRLPPEFTLLGFAPEPWSGPDVLAWVKLLAWNLDSLSYSTELLAGDLIRRVGQARAQQLMPDYPTEAPLIIPAPGNDRQPEAAAAVDKMRELIGASLINDGGLGSNGWVVDGTRSATGKPQLANDPHLWTTLPGNWYVAHLSGAELDVIGATLPGLPIVITGRNRQIAWGITHLAADVQDLYLERFDSTGRMTEFRGQFEPLQIVAEPIKVKGESDITHIVRTTRHGPLISDPINLNDSQLPSDRRQGQLAPLALRWSALDPTDDTVDSFLRLNRARNWGEFKQALKTFAAPGLSFIYADADNNIGMCAAGRIPIRTARAGLTPAEGWSGANEWPGYVPFDELPQAFNPAAHFIITANNRPVGGAYKYFLGAQWAAPYRAERIKELIELKPTLGLDDEAAIQRDTVSLQARELVPLLLKLVEPQTDPQRRALQQLASWDFDARGDSAATAIYEAWVERLPRALLGDELGPQLMDRYERRFDYVSGFLAGALKEGSSPWCDDITTPEHESCSDIAVRALNEALDYLQSMQGSRIEGWRWDRVHVAVFPHPLSENNAILRRLFSRTIPNGGDKSTVNIGTFALNQVFEQRAAPSYRQLIDLSNAEPGRFITAVGQSGHLLSSHYDDYLDDWQAGRYRALRFDRSAVDQGRAATLRLTP